jgi:hypothetical protein
MDRITGPFKGFFIAAYTVENDSGFVGYAKVCMTQPDSVWSADPVEKLTSAAGFRNELDAIQAAERKAREDIAQMVGSYDSAIEPPPITEFHAAPDRWYWPRSRSSKQLP